MKDIEILYEDDFLIVVNKPAGLAVQGGKGVKSSLDKILGEIRTPAPLLVHRLDKDTSGVLLAAKGRENAARFSRLLGTRLLDARLPDLGRKTVKQYIAVCAGSPPKKEGTITDDLLIRRSMKKSETRYRVIKEGKLPLPLEFCVLELELRTGRMHQIRRHLAMNGTPILGDDKYGDFSLNKELRKAGMERGLKHGLKHGLKRGLKRPLLHASRLIINELNLDIRAPLPECFAQFVDL